MGFWLLPGDVQENIKWRSPNNGAIMWTATFMAPLKNILEQKLGIQWDWIQAAISELRLAGENSNLVQNYATSHTDNIFTWFFCHKTATLT